MQHLHLTDGCTLYKFVANHRVFTIANSLFDKNESQNCNEWHAMHIRAKENGNTIVVMGREEEKLTNKKWKPEKSVEWCAGSQ